MKSGRKVESGILNLMLRNGVSISKIAQSRSGLAEIAGPDGSMSDQANAGGPDGSIPNQTFYQLS